MSSVNGFTKPDKWDEVIERCYIHKEITAVEAMRILGVSKTEFYKLARKDNRFNHETKARYGGVRTEEDKEKLINLSKEIKSYKSLLMDKDNQLNNLEKRFQDMKNQLDNLENTKSILKDKNNQLDNLESLLKDKDNQLNNLEKRFQNKNYELENTKSLLKDKDNQLDNLEKRFQDKKNQLDNLEKRFQNINNQLESTKSETKELIEKNQKLVDFIKVQEKTNNELYEQLRVQDNPSRGKQVKGFG